VVPSSQCASGIDVFLSYIKRVHHSICAQRREIGCHGQKEKEKGEKGKRKEERKKIYFF
jgi:hypothetical protein